MVYTVHGIFQARILQWVAFPFSRGSDQPRDQTQVSCIAGDSLPTEPPGNPSECPVKNGFFRRWAIALNTGGGAFNARKNYATARPLRPLRSPEMDLSSQNMQPVKPFLKVTFPTNCPSALYFRDPCSLALYPPQDQNIPKNHTTNPTYQSLCRPQVRKYTGPATAWIFPYRTI